MPLQVHGRAGIVPAHVVGFNQVARAHGAAVADGEGPVGDGGNEGTPDAVRGRGRVVSEKGWGERG